MKFVVTYDRNGRVMTERVEAFQWTVEHEALVFKDNYGDRTAGYGRWIKVEPA